jgi:macrolide-specific efflux system membrane fusion protein
MKGFSKIRLTAVLLTVFLVFRSLYGCNILPAEENVLAPPLVKPIPIDYKTSKVVKKDITNSISKFGTIVSRNVQSVAFGGSGGQFNGYSVKLNDKVKKGDVLATLSVGTYENDLKQMKDAVTMAELELKILNTQLKTASGDEAELLKLKIQIKEIEISGFFNQLSMIEARFTNTKIVAPFDGVVTFIDSNVNPGSQVDAYTPIVSVSDNSELLLFYQSPNIYSNINIGMDVTASYNNKKFTGKIIYVTGKGTPPNEALKNGVLMKIDKMTSDMVLGELVNFSIALETKKNVLVIQKAAFHQMMDRQYVLVLEGDSKKEIDVEVGISSETEIEILSGLEEGQSIILN